MRYVLPVVLVLVIGTASLFAAPENHVKAQLLADVSAVAPGHPFDVGVLMKIDPGWDVYWQNPGDAGLATSVRFTLPDGWKASDLRFPLPTQFTVEHSVTYGYENEVMLLATITPPANARAGENATISAAVAWLVCKQVCING